MSGADLCSTHNLPEEYILDPYVLEIYGDENWMWLCPECYYERCQDI